jgi:signal peptidase II
VKEKTVRLFSLCGLLFCLDQWTKLWVRSRLVLGDESALIPNFISITHFQNFGLGFGFLSSAPIALKELFLIGVPVFALVLIILVIVKLQDGLMMTSIALAAILTGAVSNLIDRIRQGFVVDIFKLYVPFSSVYPKFNVADLCILFGILLLSFTLLVDPKPDRQQI